MFADTLVLQDIVKCFSELFMQFLMNTKNSTLHKCTVEKKAYSHVGHLIKLLLFFMILKSTVQTAIFNIKYPNII